MTAAPALGSFMTAARTCAAAMLDNALYMRRELESVSMPDALRAQAAEVCNRLISTKHDVFSEVSEMEDLAGPPHGARLTDRAERLRGWLSDDLRTLHELLELLKTWASRHPESGAACVLVAESAANILRVYGDVDAAVRRMRA